MDRLPGTGSNNNNSNSVGSSVYSGDSDDDASYSREEAARRRLDEKEHGKKCALAESRVVRRLKCMVLSVLLASAVGAAAWVGRYARSIEERSFESRFETDAAKVLEALASSVAYTLHALDSLSAILTSHAVASNSTWPFVTVPHFAFQAAKILPLSNVMFIGLQPLVRPHQRRQWEEYSTLNDGWVNQSMTLQADWDGYYGPVIYDWQPNSILHSTDVDLPYNLSRDYLPNWQTFPTIPHYAPYGYDWLSATYTDAMYACLLRNRAVISETYLLPRSDDVEAQAEAAVWADFYSDYIPATESPHEPVTDFYYPIVNRIDRIDVSSSADSQALSNEVVGILAAPFYWRSMIRGNLPSDSKGVAIVFDSPCNEPFTYEINGPYVEYRGTGDFHDEKYDDMCVDNILNQDQHFSSTANAVYSGARLDTDTCPITVRVCPSDHMRNEFVSNQPLIFALGAVAIFVFTSIVFIAYDFFVERRQRVVLTTANRSSAIVSSLFPSGICGQLYPATKVALCSAETSFPQSAGRRHSTSSFFESKSPKVAVMSRYKRPSGTPIAELYKETTVCFADIVGFTAWSSTRRPTDVFLLLETLYAAFDDIANRHGVFKVETIGDSYVAVAGLPTPRKNHAVVMARFAQHCIDAMTELTAELDASLGPGTASLNMRVGLNSGETTAGVLRGEKARFQLFGDTVNTASRMESNGAPTRIQVSQTTADLLQRSGKDHWLTERSDTIHAKGKGHMQTYWCNPLAVESL